MPLYEYQCEACDHRFELIQKFSDEPETTCPECGGFVRKLISSPAIQFKGSGWYITDYARKPKDGQPETSSETPKKVKESASSKTTDKSSSAKKDSTSSSSTTNGKTE